MGTSALFALNNPGIVSIPLGFAVTIMVSLLDGKRG
jgi:cation/acetate symporter